MAGQSGGCRGDSAGSMLGAVNYEDRTDLLPPERVVSAQLLARLRLIPDAARLAGTFRPRRSGNSSPAPTEKP